MPKNEVEEETVYYTPADLPELRARLTGLLVTQHSDARSLRDIKRDMMTRGKQINDLSDLIEQIEDQALDARVADEDR